jgi:hypothetical protein
LVAQPLADSVKDLQGHAWDATPARRICNSRESLGRNSLSRTPAGDQAARHANIVRKRGVIWPEIEYGYEIAHAGNYCVSQ